MTKLTLNYSNSTLPLFHLHPVHCPGNLWTRGREKSLAVTIDQWGDPKPTGWHEDSWRYQYLSDG